MVKRANKSEPEAGMVKVVDPLYDAPVVVDEQPEPQAAPRGPTFGQRVRRFFEFLLRLVALLIILGILGLGLYYGLPLLYQKYIVPVEQNTAGVNELQARQEQLESQVSDLQTKLGTIESLQNQHDQMLNALDGRMDEVETQITAHTQSLAALEQIQSELQTQNESGSVELERQVNLLKAMELMSRARLFMYQSNFGLARQDVQVAHDLLVTVQKDAPEALADDLSSVVLHLGLTLANLPNFPVAASDDLDIAWQILIQGLPPTRSGVSEPSTPLVTFTPTPQATFTPTPPPFDPTATPSGT